MNGFMCSHRSTRLQVGNGPHSFKWLGRLAAAVGLTVLFSGAPVSAAPAAGSVRNIVLVHGAFADGSSWSQVISRLQAKGYHVTAVQNPLTSLADDVGATVRVLRRQQGDVLLVGHSWAGAVISQAGNASNVKGLVYLSALAPDSGESVADLLEKFKAPMDGLTPDSEGLIWLEDPQVFQQVMAADLPLNKVRVLAATQQPIAVASFAGKVRHAAWHDKPSWYLKTTSDQALRPDVQQAIAQRMGARITSVDSSHLSLLSHPDAVAGLIDRAAREAGQ
ncbi:putative hydrolase or acyltransferase of alpha/beta superfamily [Pseudomonas asplenii]|uniref:Putative hydrolase or acyltransferase of alpha/beta superfamily n=1 Tax=Pseudomonas asplenii TaxID=53407 RepID=A0A0N0VJ23_9PSED|nr:putative hydrolase or acyltransferase of alpha/beta superfamily [Pseudomonas fuscovaginae]